MEKLFGTDGIRGKVGVYPLTDEMIQRIGCSSAEFVKRQNPHKRKSQRICIAKDTRVSGDAFEENLIKGIVSRGVEIARFGILPTPASAYLVKELNYDLAIVISASHNNIGDNGFKFFTHKGYKLSASEEEEIEKIISEDTSSETTAQETGKEKEEKGAALSYVNFLKGIVSENNISQYKIAFDCGFGATSHILPQIIKALGLNAVIINASPNGENINQSCGALFPNIIAEAVIKEGASCGFAFDGDGDRVMACDEKGQVLDGDFMLAIIGKYLSEKSQLNKNTIVTTQMANLGLEMSVSQWGGRLVKTEVGDKFVLEKMLKGKYNLGGEQSGHMILLDYTTTGDALLTAFFILKIMAEQNKSLASLSRCMYKFPQILVNVEVDKKRPFEEMPKLKKAIQKCETKLGSKGRLYIRYSGTENKLRVMVEGQNQLQIKELAEEIASVAKEELSA